MEIDNMMYLRDMVIQQLKAGGHDGLISGDETCGCKLNDLMPCDGEWQGIASCQAGHVVPCPGASECEFGGPEEGCTWHIAEGKKDGTTGCPSKPVPPQNRIIKEGDQKNLPKKGI